MRNVRGTSRPTAVADRHDTHELERELQGVKAELSRAQLCVEAAVAVIPLIRTMVPDYRDRVLVVEDIVDRWLGLSDVDRAGYRIGCSLRPNALAEFCGDYCDAVEQVAASRCVISVPELSCVDEERIVNQVWSAHVRRLWQRHAV
jgi:hypothetical protein